MPNEDGTETREEALERVQAVQATQIFGDTPTDPTIGDTVAVAHDEEGATQATAAVDAAAEDGNEEAADLSPEEAKRQNEPLSAQDVQEDDSTRTESTLPDALGVSNDDVDGDGDVDDDDRKAAEVIADIESADSAEEVDRLASGDDRVTVQRAADKRKEELSE